MKIAGFIHVVLINNWEEIFQDQMQKIIRSGLYDVSESINVTLLGEYHNSRRFPYEKINIGYKSMNLTEFEYPTLSLIENYCKHNNDALVWYIHSKGVSKTDRIMKSRMEDWRKYMEWFVIENYRSCIDSLNKYDACGVNWHEKPSKHFSGNFWWSKSSYIKTLPTIQKLNRRKRYNAEFWIGMNNNVKVKNFFESNINHYLASYKAENYQNMVKNDL